MFRWNYNHSIEMGRSIEESWDFFTDPKQWTKWEKKFDAYTLLGDFRPGAQIKAKLKNKSIHLLILVTEVNLYSECRFLVKTPFFRQESLTSFEVLPNNNTRITFLTDVTSLFVPFVKSKLLKSIEETYENLNQFLRSCDPKRLSTNPGFVDSL